MESVPMPNIEITGSVVQHLHRALLRLAPQVPLPPTIRLQHRPRPPHPPGDGGGPGTAKDQGGGGVAGGVLRPGEPAVPEAGEGKE